MISIKLIPNLLSSQTDDCIGVVAEKELPKFHGDFDNPLELFGLKLEDKQLKTCTNSDLVNSIIQEGRSVFTPVINIRFSVKGSFNGMDDDFDEHRHEKKINITPGRSIKLKMKETKQ